MIYRLNFCPSKEKQFHQLNKYMLKQFLIILSTISPFSQWSFDSKVYRGKNYEAADSLLEWTLYREVQFLQNNQTTKNLTSNITNIENIAIPKLSPLKNGCFTNCIQESKLTKSLIRWESAVFLKWSRFVYRLLLLLKLVTFIRMSQKLNFVHRYQN